MPRQHEMHDTSRFKCHAFHEIKAVNHARPTYTRRGKGFTKAATKQQQRNNETINHEKTTRTTTTRTDTTTRLVLQQQQQQQTQQ